MVSPPLIVLSFLATFMLDAWRYCRIYPVWRLLNTRVGMMTVATIGASGGPRYLRYRPRDWRVSWRVVCLSVASFAAAYYLRRRTLPGGTG
jgi:hypothetical protein